MKVSKVLSIILCFNILSFNVVSATSEKCNFSEAKSALLSDNCTDFYDTNGDGIVNVLDAVRIKKDEFGLNDHSSLNGKSVIIFGDSISAGSSCNGGYGTILQEKYGMKVTNLAINGATVTLKKGQTMDSIINHIAVMDRYEQPDFVIFNGGSNDYDNNRPVGSISDKWDFTEKTEYETYSDAMEYIIYHVLKKWVGTKIIYLTTHKQQRGELLETYFNQGKEVCRKWGIPVCDLYENCGLNINIIEYRRYTDEGGTHPNKEGYERYYIPMIIDELERHVVN